MCFVIIAFAETKAESVFRKFFKGVISFGLFRSSVLLNTDQFISINKTEFFFIFTFTVDIIPSDFIEFKGDRSLFSSKR